MRVFGEKRWGQVEDLGQGLQTAGLLLVHIIPRPGHQGGPKLSQWARDRKEGEM